MENKLAGWLSNLDCNNCKEGEEGGSICKMMMGWQGNKPVEKNHGKEDAIYQMTSTESEDVKLWTVLRGGWHQLQSLLFLALRM
jgi:hypothetical protein